MSNDDHKLIALVCLMLTVVAITITVTIGYVTSQPPYMPVCQEDEVMYYDDYPDGNLVCIHMEEFRE